MTDLLATLQDQERSLRATIREAADEIDRLSRTHGDRAAHSSARRRYDRASTEHVLVLARIDALEIEQREAE